MGMNDKKLYRARIFINTIGPYIYYDEYTIFKETEKGYWILPSKFNTSNNKKWIAKKGKRVFARLKKEDALRDLKYRLIRQKKIFESKIIRNSQSISVVNNELGEKEPAYEYENWSRLNYVQ